MSQRHIRPSALASRWYPGNPDDLRTSVLAMIDGDGNLPVPKGHPVVAVVPHAGHTWSGTVAGRVYAHLKGTVYDRIVLLAPNHRLALNAVSAPIEDDYETPLGRVAIDQEGRAELLANGGVVSVPGAHADEHAEEIQLPFFQVLWADVPPVLPLLVPCLSTNQRRILAKALGRWCDGRTLVVVSTDFTHYGAAFGYVPFTDDIPTRLAKLDGGAIDHLLDWDAPGLLAYGRRTGITMCGLEAAVLAMSLPWPLRPSMSCLGYERSADRDGDFAMSVSYAALLGVLPIEVSP